MHLVLPARALFEIGYALDGDMRAVLLLKLKPCGVPLGRRHIGVSIYYMLELVHRRTVRDERKCVKRVHVPVGRSSCAEELLHIRPREKLHAHRVRLRRLHAAAVEFEREAVIGDEPRIEGVPRLVGHDVDIPGGAVKVCKDERLAIFDELRAVASAPFVFAGVNIEGFVLEHHVDKLTGLGAHGMVHLSRGGEYAVLPAGARVAAGDEDFVIIELIVLNAHAPCVLCAQGGDSWDDIPQDVLPELRDRLPVVAQAIHAAVAQLNEVIIAELLCHTISHMDERIEYPVKLRAVLLKRCAEALHRLAAGAAVTVLEIAQQRRARQLLAAEVKLHPGHQLGVFADEPVLLDHVINDDRGYRLALKLHRSEQQRRKLPLKLRAERRIEQRGSIVGNEIVHGGACLVIIIVLGRAKLIGNVNGIAHIGKRAHGMVLGIQAQIVLARGEDIGCTSGIADAAYYLLHRRAERVKPDAVVWQL